MATYYCRHSDLIRDVAVIVGGTESTTYPLENLCDGDPSKPCILLTNTEVRFVWDFGTAERVDGLVMPMHNIPAGNTIYLQGHTADSWASPTVSQSLVMPTWEADGFPPSVMLDATVATNYSAAGLRFWSVLFPAQTLVHAIGELLLVRQWRTLAYNWDWGGKVREKRWNSIVKTEYGVKHVTSLGAKMRSWNMQFDTTDAGLEDLFQLWRNCYGPRYSWVLVPDSTLSPAYYVQFAGSAENTFEYTDNFLNSKKLTIELEETQRGLPL